MLRFWMIFNNPQENATVTRILSSLFLDDYLVDKVLAPRTRTSWSNPKSSKPCLLKSSSLFRASCYEDGKWTKPDYVTASSCIIDLHI